MKTLPDMVQKSERMVHNSRKDKCSKFTIKNSCYTYSIENVLMLVAIYFIVSEHCFWLQLALVGN